MNDKLPPRSPFGIPGEKTVIRPNPGGRRAVPPQPPAYSPVPQAPGPPQPAAPAATPYVPPAAPGNPNAEEWITTQAQARALWQSDGNLTLVGTSLPTAICRLEQQLGAVKSFIVDAIQGPVDTATPGLRISNLGDGTDASCFLEIEIPGSIGA